MIFTSSDTFTPFRFNFAKDVGQFFFGFVWQPGMWRIFLQLHHFVRMFHFALAQAISCQNVNEFENSLSHDSNTVWHQCQFERTSHVNGALFKYGMHPHPFLGSKLWREGVNISPHVLGCDVFCFKFNIGHT